jgi:GntR family transcriptional regulator
MAGMVVSDTVENIRSLIARGEVGLGGKLPSEREMADMFCVSRSSVREALMELREQGGIESRRGRRGGTFVAADGPFWQNRGRMEVLSSSAVMVNRRAGQLWTLQNEMPRHGYQLETEVISACLERCPKNLCEMFGLVDSRSLYRIVRKRSSEGEPISYEQTYCDPAQFPDMLKQDLTQSILLLVLNHYHMAATEVEERIEVVAAQGKMAQHLKVGTGSSLLQVNLLIVDSSDKALLYSHDHYRPDHMRLTVRNRVESPH